MFALNSGNYKKTLGILCFFFGILRAEWLWPLGTVTPNKGSCMATLTHFAIFRIPLNFVVGCHELLLYSPFCQLFPNLCCLGIVSVQPKIFTYVFCYDLLMYNTADNITWTLLSSFMLLFLFMKSFYQVLSIVCLLPNMLFNIDLHILLCFRNQFVRYLPKLLLLVMINLPKISTFVSSFGVVFPMFGGWWTHFVRHVSIITLFSHVYLPMWDFTRPCPRCWNSFVRYLSRICVASHNILSHMFLFSLSNCWL